DKPSVLGAAQPPPPKRNQVIIKPHPGELEPPPNNLNQLQVVRPDTSIQTVVRLVSHRYDFVGILELRHTQDGTKDLVTTNLHPARHFSEDRRFEKASFVEPLIARLLASLDQFRALLA